MYDYSQNHVGKCEFERVDCSFKRFGCNEKVPRKSLDEHVTVCGYVPVPCSHCQEEVGRILLQVCTLFALLSLILWLNETYYYDHVV